MSVPFRYILDKKIPVEVTMLCRFLELVVGSFVMAWSLNRTRSLHGVTLPRSWILENVRNLHKVQNKDAHPHFAWTTTGLFRALLENIYTGSAGERSIDGAHIVTDRGQTTFSTIICLSTPGLETSPWRDCAYA